MTAWVCPACGRRVPATVTACRCGAERAVAGTDAARSEPSRRDRPRITAGNIGIGVAIGLAAVIMAVSWTNRRTAPRLPPPATVAAPAVVPAVMPPSRPDVPPPAAASAAGVEQQPVPARAAAVQDTLEDIVSRSSPAVVTVLADGVRGSGFFVAYDTVLTNVHVVSPNSSVTIRRTDGTTTTARVERSAPAFDIAVLKVSNPRPDQPTIPMGTVGAARVGEDVIVIGTPLGYLSNSVSRGIVSGLRAVSGATMIQTDAAINPGNSGGPLLNRSGQAIGVVNSSYDQRNGLAFAVAIDHARALLSGDAPVPAQRGPDSAQYKALSPEVPSPSEQTRVDGVRAFEQVLARLGLAAGELDERWRSFKSVCYEGRMVGSFDHEWYAVFDRRSMQGAVSPGCGSPFDDLRRAAASIRDEVVAADEAARRADVYPGVRRDTLRRYHLDYGGWFR